MALATAEIMMERTSVAESLMDENAAARPLDMSARFELDRASMVPLSDQIFATIAATIEEGVLAEGDKLPSWRDLAAQLGVARGTIRAAYDRLIDKGLAEAAGASGTRVVGFKPRIEATLADRPLLRAGFPLATYEAPLAFQMGAPSQDAFPRGVWAKHLTRAARIVGGFPTGRSDPRGDPELRRQIAAYLALGRGVVCSPTQVFITSGHSGSLGFLVHALGLRAKTVWVEDPGYPLTKAGLECGGATAHPVSVDREGIDVEEGRATAPNAAAAVVTAASHAPTGVPLSPQRRTQLRAWAAACGAWIIEDDFLGELQLGARPPAPLAASADEHVIYVGTFSKTLAPWLSTGFVVAPPGLIERFEAVAGLLSPASGAVEQRALASFIEDGSFVRHIRRMKSLYIQNRIKLIAQFAPRIEARAFGSLSIMLPMAQDACDSAAAKAARNAGMAPMPFSAFYVGAPQRGLLLSVANLPPEDRLASSCMALADIVAGR